MNQFTIFSELYCKSSFQIQKEKEKRKRLIKRFILGMFIFVCILVLYSFAKNKDKVECVKSHSYGLSIKEMKYLAYFHKSGNKHPEQMAKAVLATPQPKLMAAIAVRGEKNTPYTVRKGGYKKRHTGSFQQNEKDWGKVPYTPLEQAIKAEKDLSGLIQEKGNFEAALNQWGGDKTKKVYAKNILEELNKVP